MIFIETWEKLLKLLVLMVFSDGSNKKPGYLVCSVVQSICCENIDLLKDVAYRNLSVILLQGI